MYARALVDGLGAGTGRVASGPAVTVVIPARDASRAIDRTLTALAAQTVAEPFEVIVVDDGSRDDTAAIVARHAPLVRLERNARSQGPGAARNRGVGAARAPVLAFTDADCFPAPEWLARGLAALADADLVQGAVQADRVPVRTPFDRTVTVERESGFYETANLFVRRETFAAVGGFRDWALEQEGRRRWSADRRRGRATRTPIGEDTLFGWSARRLGARSAFAPDAVVFHEVVPGGVRDDVADRWHWTRDMPGLARHVPELRATAFHRRWFFNARSARFDLALAGAAVSAVTRRRLPLAAAAPYAVWLAREARPWGLRRGAELALGTPAADLATCVGLLAGSVAWRCPVL